MEKIRLWKVEDSQIREIKSAHLDLEERLHKSIEQDLSILLPNAFLIGSKIKTDHDKEVDLLAVDSEGDLVIIELKRGMTPREVVAQVLDYTAWAALRSEDDLNEMLRRRGETRTVEELFNEKLPNFEYGEVNQNQKILIVGASIDLITERIVRYLATKGLSINVATFDFFQEGEHRFIARNFLMDDEVVAVNERRDVKRAGRFAKRLFQNGSLKIGDVVVFEPAKKQGFEGDPRIEAEVVNYGQNCLKRRTGDSRLYSFSRLRYELVHELNLQGIKIGWGYGQWEEWTTINGKKLIEL